MKRTQLIVRAFIAAFIAVFIFACDFVTGGLQEMGERSVESTEESFTVGAAPTLTIDNFAGEIQIRAGESGTIRVVANRRARNSSDLERIDVNMAESDGDVTIETEKPQTVQNASVDFEISVPPDTRVEARTGGGDIRLSDLDGDATVNTGGGTITVDGATGDVRANTGGGDITIEGVSGQVEADTGGGTITVRGESSNVIARSGGGDLRIEGAQGEIEADTGGGAIFIRDSSGSIQADTGGGDIDVENASGQITASTGGGSINYSGRLEDSSELQTGGGDIVVEFPADSNLELDLEVPSSCNDCEIRVAFDVDGNVSQRLVRGTIGGGDGGTLHARTGGGDIVVESQ